MNSLLAARTDLWAVTTSPEADINVVSGSKSLVRQGMSGSDQERFILTVPAVLVILANFDEVVDQLDTIRRDIVFYFIYFLVLRESENSSQPGV